MSSLTSSSVHAELLGVTGDVREVLGDVRCVHDHHDLVGEAVDEAVVFDRAAVVEDRRVVHLADRERGDVVRRDVVDEIDRRGTGPRMMNSPMCETSNSPQRSRTALCSTVMPGGYCTGIS